MLREAVVHVGREGLVGSLGHETLLVEEGQDARRLGFDQGNAVRGFEDEEEGSDDQNNKTER